MLSALARSWILGRRRAPSSNMTTGGCWVTRAFCMLGHSDDDDSTMKLAVPVSDFTHNNDTSSQIDTADSGLCFSIACNSCLKGVDAAMMDLSCQDMMDRVDDEPPLQVITVMSGVPDRHRRKKVRYHVPNDYTIGDQTKLPIEPLSPAEREAMRKLLLDLQYIKPFMEQKNSATVESSKPMDTLKMVELYKDPVTGQRKAKVHKIDEVPESKAPSRRKVWLRRLLLIRMRRATP